MPRKLAVLALIAAAAPASSQTLLDQLIAKAVKPKAATQPGQAGAFTAAVTPAQSTALDALLNQPLQDPRIAADRAEASALIRTVIVTGACATAPEAWNATNRYHMAPQSGWDNTRVPMFGLRYHDKSRCLDVARITDWAKPALNALRFRVYYLAADSGEASSQGFELQKSSDGQWLIREIGMKSL